VEEFFENAIRISPEFHKETLKAISAKEILTHFFGFLK
jgi:hypothetical protein